MAGRKKERKAISYFLVNLLNKKYSFYFSRVSWLQWSSPSGGIWCNPLSCATLLLLLLHPHATKHATLLLLLLLHPHATKRAILLLLLLLHPLATKLVTLLLLLLLLHPHATKGATLLLLLLHPPPIKRGNYIPTTLTCCSKV